MLLHIAEHFWVSPQLHHLAFPDLPLLKGDTLHFVAPVIQSAMCLMPVFPLLGPLLAAIQFTKQAGEYQKVGTFFWASEQSCADGCKVQWSSVLPWRWRGLAGWEQKQKRRKREKKRGEKLSSGSDKLSAWLLMLEELSLKCLPFPAYSCSSENASQCNFLYWII